MPISSLISLLRIPIDLYSLDTVHSNRKKISSGSKSVHDIYNAVVPLVGRVSGDLRKSSPLLSSSTSSTSRLHLQFLNLTMSARSVVRALPYSAKRRVFQPPTPYRCFSCTYRAQEQTKSDHERMTHFGFTNVPESEKESRGKSLIHIGVASSICQAQY